MFHTIRRLLFDLRLALAAESQDGDLVSLSEKTNGQEQREAAARVAAQLLITLGVIALCAFVAVRPNPSDASIKLAHMGFGVVIGYWFR
jgi:hypothetical protein